MLANSIVVLSCIVFALALLDLLLSDDQKETISNFTVRTWNFLDEMRSRSYTDWLKRPIILQVLTAVAFVTFAFFGSVLVFNWRGVSDALLYGGVLMPFTQHSRREPNIIALIGYFIGVGGGIYIARKAIRGVLLIQSSIHLLIFIGLVLGFAIDWGLGLFHNYTTQYYIENP
jgi:hypothetical protein